MRVAIGGLGRIGRTVLRQILLQRPDIEILGLNDIAPIETCAYLLQFDSVFGPFPQPVTVEGDAMVVMGRRLPFARTGDVREIDLSGADVFLDCTGKAQSRAFASRPIEAGARQVLISGPSGVADATVVLGANEASLGAARIVSNASCTTNALAPLLKALDLRFGVLRAHMTTIHCYTGSQPMIDAPRDDLARSRAGALSMVPTTTSAAHQIDVVLPHLSGRVTGAAVRVPVASVSAVDLVVQCETPPDGPLGTALRDMADASAVMGWTAQPNVSTDMRARPESIVLALPECMVATGGQIRVFGWYDNEWGFSARMLDMAERMVARPEFQRSP
ncbi:MAG: glyceraldehyde-3-phosphate dehydrogenase [Rhodobacteraceae bacterium]|nr:glyceraldehyde-3-phosphate dehydrogenase [Paracoccaceae bacterium]